MYQSLYRRYRPQRFEEVVGQEHVTRALRNAVRDGRVTHAYLFSGPRGTGKTSSARILAKALNCTQLDDGEPCGRCESCVAITAGTSSDVFELDAASNNGVDAMRDLVSRAALGNPGRSKVYIVDEVHMLTAAASNALLKTLEEPPGHVVFVLATTDPQKVLPTVRSRTQHYDFRLLRADALGAHLRAVAADAGLDVDDATIDAVARRGAGSVRDALSALDQVAAAGGVDDVAAPTEAVVDALCEHDPARALVVVAEACGRGLDPRQLARDVVDHLRQAFLSLLAPELVEVPVDARERLDDQARRLGAPSVVRAIEVLGQALVDLRDAVDPRIAVEVALVRLARPDADATLDALAARVERLERGSAEPQTSHPSPEASHSAQTRQAPRTPIAPKPPARQPSVQASVVAAETAAPSAPAAPPPAPAAPRPALGAFKRRTVATDGASPPKPAQEGGDAASPYGALPTRDDLTLAWADVVLPGLDVKARRRWETGRWLAVEGGVAIYAVDNAVHQSQCDRFRDAVEDALAAHFGRRVPVRLVVESPGARTAGPEAAVDGATAPGDDEVDLAELTDAPEAEVPSGVDRLLQAFPNATVLEE